jgi:hypothetical protein
MIGLVVVFSIATYASISIWIVVRVASWARKTNRNASLWSGVTAVILYNLVLWDWLPTTQLQRYYCNRDAGLWVYTSPAEWKENNPESATSQTDPKPLASVEHSGIRHVYRLNDRIAWIHDRSTIWPEVRRHERTIVDTQTQHVLVREIYFQTGLCGRAPQSALDYRFWMDRCECAADRRNTNGGFLALEESFADLGARQ